MEMQRARPVVVGDAQSPDPCAHCDVRHQSVCSAIEEADLARLAAVAVVRSVDKGKVFIEEGEPATDFFNVTAGTAKLFKLLPDGRQQITGFAGLGHFLGLAVSQTYAFSAEAIEPMRFCRFSRPKLRLLLDDFPALEARLLQSACNELVTAQEQMLLLGRKTARGARGQLPGRAQPGDALRQRHRPHPVADDPRRNRGLSGPDARNREPDAQPLQGREAHQRRRVRRTRAPGPAVARRTRGRPDLRRATRPARRRPLSARPRPAGPPPM